MAEDTIQINVAGHQIRLAAADDEVEQIQESARRVSDAIQKLSQKLGGAASPSKVATMVAFQYAYELSMTDAMLDEAERLHKELHKEREAVKRLESLLARADDALAL